MSGVHLTPSACLSRATEVVLVGCGGNGSQMLTGLARLNHALVALGHPGLRVVVFDPDTVSEANMGRQLFSAADVGLFKSVVLVHRVNMHFGLEWIARPKRCEAGELHHLQAGTIVIVCVDSAHARLALHKIIVRRRDIYVLDLGNRSSDGQVIFGHTPLDKVQIAERGEIPLRTIHPAESALLPYPYDLLPELIDTSRPDDDTPSCGLAEALERQELFVNQSVVTPALAILWEFFRHGRITWHGAFVNLKTGSMRPVPVPERKAHETDLVAIPA
ncbi:MULTISPECIES: PRTRC system ThiF family protein [Cupriavidus]